jgi:ferredoxin-NADP reductase
MLSRLFNRPAAMIASGIGMTTFRSMLQALGDENATLSGAIVRATHGPIDVPFRDELEALARCSGLRLSRENGPVDEVQLRTLAAEIAGPVWYIAGRVEDVKQLRELLGSISVGKEDIRLEAFRYAGRLASPSNPSAPVQGRGVPGGAPGHLTAWNVRLSDGLG